ncbi:hypothetical protein [Rickettsia endosymbiont of Halotydeus destructor]|uniref:hypothetical protein n=1 Tax=Rickettsia endosymbiont of Halotydeus destructor TaxID=2996754 RepID=UPI003BB110E9
MLVIIMYNYLFTLIRKIIKQSNITKKRKPGYWEGKVIIKEDFDNLPKDFMDFFK